MRICEKSCHPHILACGSTFWSLGGQEWATWQWSRCVGDRQGPHPIDQRNCCQSFSCLVWLLVKGWEWLSHPQNSPKRYLFGFDMFWPFEVTIFSFCFSLKNWSLHVCSGPLANPAPKSLFGAGLAKGPEQICKLHLGLPARACFPECSMPVQTKSLPHRSEKCTYKRYCINTAYHTQTKTQSIILVAK